MKGEGEVGDRVGSGASAGAGPNDSAGVEVRTGTGTGTVPGIGSNDDASTGTGTRVGVAVGVAVAVATDNRAGPGDAARPDMGRGREDDAGGTSDCGEAEVDAGDSMAERSSGLI